MRCSFIVSVYSRPWCLAGVLWSLAVQTVKDFEVIVTDNLEAASTEPPWSQMVTEEVAARTGLPFHYMRTSMMSCYHSAEVGAQRAQGEYLCFPSDDGYYVPQFLENMLSRSEGADLIYCDCLYRVSVAAWSDKYRHHNLMEVELRRRRIDKGGFLVKRELFNGFSGKDPGRGYCEADGVFIDEVMRRRGVVARKAPGILWVHS